MSCVIEPAELHAYMIFICISRKLLSHILQTWVSFLKLTCTFPAWINTYCSWRCCLFAQPLGHTVLQGIGFAVVGGIVNTLVAAKGLRSRVSHTYLFRLGMFVPHPHTHTHIHCGCLSFDMQKSDAACLSAALWSQPALVLHLSLSIWLICGPTVDS